MIRLTETEYRELVTSDIGICKACGAHRDCCEPDARNYTCEDCGEDEVFGTEELLMEGEIEFG
ncbi:MAG TPA: hypothetical protein VMX17_12705 [Candidatus Glassbacteria bacterium]|nr:hypothetical protein [Candidatus Glassbacteria bacterium]